VTDVPVSEAPAPDVVGRDELTAAMMEASDAYGSRTFSQPRCGHSLVCGVPTGLRIIR
jgi:hypothetical protein